MKELEEFKISEDEAMLIHHLTLSGVEGLTISIKGIEGVLNDSDNILKEDQREIYENSLDDAKVSLGIAKSLIERLEPIVTKLIDDVCNNPQEIKPPKWGQE